MLAGRSGQALRLGSARHRKHAAIICRATSSSPFPGAGSQNRQMSPEDVEKRTKQLTALLQESANIAIQTGGHTAAAPRSSHLAPSRTCVTCMQGASWFQEITFYGQRSLAGARRPQRLLQVCPSSKRRSRIGQGLPCQWSARSSANRAQEAVRAARRNIHQARCVWTQLRGDVGPARLAMMCLQQ